MTRARCGARWGQRALTFRPEATSLHSASRPRSFTPLLGRFRCVVLLQPFSLRSDRDGVVSFFPVAWLLAALMARLRRVIGSSGRVGDGCNAVGQC